MKLRLATDDESRMKQLFVPGPMLMMLIGLVGTFVPSVFWFAIALAVIGVPATLLFMAASFREFRKSFQH